MSFSVAGQEALAAALTTPDWLPRTPKTVLT
jgi:hypothetical protein